MNDQIGKPMNQDLGWLGFLREYIRSESVWTCWKPPTVQVSWKIDELAKRKLSEPGLTRLKKYGA